MFTLEQDGKTLSVKKTLTFSKVNETSVFHFMRIDNFTPHYYEVKKYFNIVQFLQDVVKNRKYYPIESRNALRTRQNLLTRYAVNPIH